MRIAFASENMEERELFRNNMTAYFEKRSIQLEMDVFENPDKMLESVADTIYDIVFFSMNYEKHSGVNYVYKMRVFNPDTAIVILQFTPYGRTECILNKPVKIILDDFSFNSCSSMLDIIYEHINNRQELSILIRTTKNIEKFITIGTIIFAECSNHLIHIHMSNGEIIEIQGPIRKLAERLKEYSEFLFPHRSFIVNAFYVSCVTPNKIYLRNSSTVIPIARGKMKTIKENINDYFRNYRRDTNLYHTYSGAK